MWILCIMGKIMLDNNLNRKNPNMQEKGNKYFNSTYHMQCAGYLAPWLFHHILQNSLYYFLHSLL